MPTPMDAMLGLLIAAIGLLTFVVAFSAADSGKRLVSYGIAGLVTVVGLIYYASSEMRGFQMRRRISDIQQRQQVNMEEIQKRLRESQQPSSAPAKPSPKR